MADCPHCEALKARIRDLERALGDDHDPPMELRLTPNQGRLLSMILARQVLTREAAMTVMYGHKVNPPDMRVMDVMVMRMRRRLEGFGIKIETVWGRGWRMTRESKERYFKLVEDIRATVGKVPARAEAAPMHSAAGAIGSSEKVVLPVGGRS